MPMPHRTQMQVIRRRLVGKEGSARIRELRAILDELPGYRNGPYADIRKWVTQEIDRTRVRSKTVHRDSIAVPREGAAQVALVGCPNTGKSSLLHAVTDIQIRTGDYAFTTLRPVAALARIRGVLVQLVEIPGLLPGASEGRGGGRALLGVLRGADAIVYCHDGRAPIEGLVQIRDEVAAAGIVKPAVLAVTKIDETGDDALARVTAAAPDLRAIGVSIFDDATLETFREAVWGLTGLVRVFTRRPGDAETEPLALAAGATALDVATALHRDLGARFHGALVWGPSARFEGQRVGRDHRVADGDIIEILR